MARPSIGNRIGKPGESDAFAVWRPEWIGAARGLVRQPDGIAAAGVANEDFCGGFVTLNQFLCKYDLFAVRRESAKGIRKFGGIAAVRIHHISPAFGIKVKLRSVG